MRLCAAALFAISVSTAAGAAEDTAAPVIEHTAVKYTERGARVVQVFARITDQSKFFPQVFYRYGPGEYQKPLDMKPVKGVKDSFGANIPVKGDLCEYYIEAYDELGNGPGRAGDPDRPFKVDTSGQGGIAVAEAPKPVPAASSPWAAKPAPPPAVKVEPAPPPAPRRVVVAQQSSGGRTWTWVAGGIGLGLLGGGAIAGSAMKSADDVYTKNLATAPGADYADLKAQYDANKSLGSKATILMAAGGVLLVTSVILFFVEGGSSHGSGGDGAMHF